MINLNGILLRCDNWAALTFKKIPYHRPNFRAYDNDEMFVPNPDMVKRFVYRIRSIPNKAMILLSVETGSSSGEAWSLEWKDINF